VLFAAKVSVPRPDLVRPPLPLIAPVSVALLPLVLMMPPCAASTIGVVIASLAPLIRSVPPVKVAAAPAQFTAPAVLAMKIPPLPSIALPLPHMPGPNGWVPAAMVPREVRAPVPAPTENIATLLLPKLIAYRAVPSGLIARPPVCVPLAIVPSTVLVAALNWVTVPSVKLPI
jgi:hypothetical protein